MVTKFIREMKSYPRNFRVFVIAALLFSFWAIVWLVGMVFSLWGFTSAYNAIESEYQPICSASSYERTLVKFNKRSSMLFASKASYILNGYAVSCEHITTDTVVIFESKEQK